MAEFKVVLSTQDGKSYQKEVKSSDADILLKYKLGEIILGDNIGFPGYEFKITGGSDKSGFPMRKGILQPRKRILIGRSVGFSGKKRDGKSQHGLLRKRTVCGEMINPSIVQINLKVLKEGAQKLGEQPSP